MWAKCIGWSRRKQQPVDAVHVLDFSNQMLTDFPKLSRKDYKITTGLIFDNNNFISVPNQLFDIINLKKISFQENNLEYIPSEISNLGLLEDANFSKNELNNVCDELALCTKIKKLDLSSNVLLVIKDCICMLTNLETLIFNDTSLADIPANIAKLENLLVFEARDNFVSVLPNEIGMLPLLKRFDMGCNEITNIPSSIKFLVNLEDLYLDSNSIMIIPSEISECKKLQILDLSSNAISLLPEEFGGLENLNELILSNNHIVSLPDSIGNLKSLKTLRLEDNMLEKLPDSITKLNELEDFYLKNNAISALPDKIGLMTSLSVLYIDNNQIKSLPDSICDCDRLKILSLNTNFLKNLPKNIGNMKMLSIIDVSNNRLEYLPYSISQLNLKALWLCPGQIKPTISLQYTSHPVEGNIVTCYLLPQSISRVQVRKSYLISRKSTSTISGTTNDLTEDQTSEDSSIANTTKNNSQSNPSAILSAVDKIRSTRVSATEVAGYINNEESNIESNVFSEVSETETVESLSSAYNYMSISSSRSSKEEVPTTEKEPQLDEFTSVTQDYTLLPQFKIEAKKNKGSSKNSKNSGGGSSSNTDYEKMTTVQLTLKKDNDLVIARDSVNELTFVDYVNPNYPNVQRGDIIAKINSIPANKFSMDKIKALVRNSIETDVILEISLEKFRILENSTIIENKQAIDFETRVIHIQSMEMTKFGALPIYFEGGASEQFLPFGNDQSPILISFVDMDIIKASSNIFEGDRLIEINNAPLSDDLKESVALSQFFFKNRHGIRSITLRNDPPAEFFLKVLIHKSGDSVGFSVNGGYYYNGALKPNYISHIGPNCSLSNGNYISVGMWIIEVNGVFVLHRRHDELMQLFSECEDNFTMVVFDVEERSKNLQLSGVLSSIPCTIDIINKYDVIERYNG